MTDVGTAQRITVTFTDLNGDAIDPTEVEIYVKAPITGDESSLDINHDDDETGVYSATFTPDEAGRWKIIARASGNIEVTRAHIKEYDALPFDPDD